MLDRTAEQFKVAPSRLVADAGYGSAEMLGWMVDGRGIEPHVKLMDKSERADGALSRSDFAFDPVILARKEWGLLQAWGSRHGSSVSQRLRLIA
jgi:hypothetical protein